MCADQIHEPHPPAWELNYAGFTNFLNGFFSLKVSPPFFACIYTCDQSIAFALLICIYRKFYGYIKLNTINDKFCKHTHTQPVQMMTSQHIPYLGNNLRVHLCGCIESPDKIKVIIITNVLVIEDDVFYLWDQIGYVCWVR